MTVAETLELETWQDEARRLARKQDAVVLAHNHMPAPIQDVADVVGDSLALARHGASTDAAKIVLCGVLFMAETAEILNPDKTVVPTAKAGCSLANGITPRPDAELLLRCVREGRDEVIVEPAPAARAPAAVEALLDLGETGAGE